MRGADFSPSARRSKRKSARANAGKVAVEPQLDGAQQTVSVRMNHHRDPLIEDQLIEDAIERAMGENTAVERAVTQRAIASDPNAESLNGSARGASAPRELLAKDAAARDRTMDRAVRDSLITELVRAPALAAPLAPPVSAAMTTAPVTASVIALSDRVVFNDEKLARKYASESIPISTLYEAYFESAIDIPGDLVAFLRSRHAFVKHTITRQHLQWAVTNFVPEIVAHSREADARAARELFDDRGEDFFRAFLGDRLAFSCAHFDVSSDTLDMGSEQMSSRICDKLGLRASHRVLDVGCGWGAFLSHVAASRGAEGIGATLSRTQEAHANRRFAELGVEHQARAMVADYRDLPAEKFDRVVCIEAVERVGVKNLKAFFEKLAEHVKDDGLLFLQWTGLRRQLRPEDLMWGLFINKHILPGADAALPLSSMLKVAEKAGWEVRGVENVSQQYVRTLELWRTNWEARRERVVAEHGERAFRVWQFFLAWSQIVAEQGSAACFQVVLNRNLDGLDRRVL
ncbi:MAG TPA: class I SAM-dependent methyltransferase [Polyangiaceae bacterium]|nr:class I SAM-dependent methyltransferase [Polyangiaceae bacterium]